MPEIFTVQTRGIGKPDYSREVSSALERRGLRLAYGQTLKIFGLVCSNIVSPYSWVTTPLASGATAHLIDNETGLPSPYTVPQGYILFIIEASHSQSEDVEIWSYVDTFLYSGMGIVTAGVQVLDHRVLGFTTALFDPTGLTPHTVDVTITNNGLGNMSGGFSIICILEEVGTPPLPTTKLVICKFCMHKETVAIEVTNWLCPECNRLNIFLNTRPFRGTG